jgi:hypothetical protein
VRQADDGTHENIRIVLKVCKVDLSVDLPLLHMMLYTGGRRSHEVARGRK